MLFQLHWCIDYQIYRYTGEDFNDFLVFLFPTTIFFFFHYIYINIHVYISGKAIEVLKSLAKEGQQYDLIYIDCIKDEYLEYYQVLENTFSYTSTDRMYSDTQGPKSYNLLRGIFHNTTNTTNFSAPLKTL